MANAVLNDSLNWLKDFEKEKGRPLRVLHVGNIANNAYINVKYLRKAGVEADVLCGDFYHIMGCPEWEEMNVTEYGGDDFYPKFNRKKEKYQRPDWFVQGPFLACCEYLIAKHEGQKIRCFILNAALTRSGLSFKYHYLWSILVFIYMLRFDILLHESNRIGQVIGKKMIRKIFRSKSEAIWNGLRYFKRKTINKLLYPKNTEASNAQASNGQASSTQVSKVQAINNVGCTSVVEQFAQAFPHRKDKLTAEEVKLYSARGILKKVSEYYDVIQCYGIEPIWAMISDVKPYIAFEHGTLRDFTLGDLPIHRLNALAYHKANHVFVTNGDCIEYAKKLNIENFSGIAHPLEGDWNLPVDLKHKIKKEFNADVLLFCPMRHDWSVKGNDIYIRALPKIIASIPGKVVLIFNEWGQEVQRSIDLIKEVGCQDNVVWMPPLCRKKLIEMMHASDVVLDQLLLPCFGGILPQTLSVGTPVIMSYKPESTAWLFKEPPPVLAAFNGDEVVSAILQAIDPEWRKAYAEKALAWFKNHHHMDIVINEHLTVYKRLVSK